jgi:hypothetical protein
VSIARKDVDDALLEAFKESLKKRFDVISSDAANQDPKEVSDRLYHAMVELKLVYGLAGHVADDVFK